MRNKTQQKEFKTNVLDEVFNINNNISVTEEEADFLFELEDRILELIEEYGETGIEKVKEEILDQLYKNNWFNIIKYLNLHINTEIEATIEKRFLEDNLKIEEVEKNQDFFSNYLIDEVINDIYYSLLGYERKSDGVKEIFKKKRKAIIPTTSIMNIKNIIISIFNKTNFVSVKDDQEQAQIIMLAYEGVFDIILELPYQLCNVEKSVAILNMIALKLSNLIGLSKDYRKDFLEAVRESYKNIRNEKNKESLTEND